MSVLLDEESIGRAVDAVEQPLLSTLAQWKDMAVGQAEAMAALLATIKTIVQSVQSIIGYMTLPETRMRAIYAII